jgi:hypothetical protein
VRLKWHVVTVPVEMSYLAVLNYHQQGLLMAAAKYLLTCFLSLLVGYYADRTARADFLAATAMTSKGSRPIALEGGSKCLGAGDAGGGGGRGGGVDEGASSSCSAGSSRCKLE